MRTRQWLASLLSGFLAAAGGLNATAQTPPFPQYGPGNPDAAGMLPPPYDANYGTHPQAYTGMEAAGYPAGANAWPNVSPYYGPAVDESSYQNGFWFNRQLSGGKRYYFTTEGLLGWVQTGNKRLIGGDNVNNIGPFTPPGVVFTDHNQQFFETTVNVADNMANREVTATGGGGGGGTGGDIQIFTPNYFGKFQHAATSGGSRNTWGWFNPDNSGFQVSGFWLDRANSGLFVGTGLGYDENLSSITGYNEARIRAYSGLPLSGADSDGDLLPGVVIPFDLYYRLRFSSQAMGANMDWYTSPVYEKESLMVRPVFGGRFIQLKEKLRFDGADSGMGYTIQGASGTAGGGGGATAADPPYSPITFEPGFSTPDIMVSALHSSVRSILAGPEVGLRFDLGGDRFKIWTQSKFGVLVNQSDRNLDGYNIGDAYYVANGRTTPVMPRDNPELTQFYRDETRISVSPMFEQSIFARAPLFQYVPYLNRAKILNNAEFQFGYTWLVVGQVYRPADIIDWQAYPVNPLLRDRKSNYVNGAVSIGIEWAY